MSMRMRNTKKIPLVSQVKYITIFSFFFAVINGHYPFSLYNFDIATPSKFGKIK